MVEIPEGIGGFETSAPEEKLGITLTEGLKYLKKNAERILDTFRRYCKEDDQRMQDDYLDVMAFRLNQFAQSFKDIVVFIQLAENRQGANFQDTLSGCIKYYEANAELDRGGKGIFDLLKKRNSLIHEYYNEQSLNKELLKGLETYGEELDQISDSLNDYCNEHFQLSMGKDVVKRVKEAKKNRNTQKTR